MQTSALNLLINQGSDFEHKFRALSGRPYKSLAAYAATASQVDIAIEQIEEDFAVGDKVLIDYKFDGIISDTGISGLTGQKMLTLESLQLDLKKGAVIQKVKDLTGYTARASLGDPAGEEILEFTVDFSLAESGIYFIRLNKNQTAGLEPTLTFQEAYEIAQQGKNARQFIQSRIVKPLVDHPWDIELIAPAPDETTHRRLQGFAFISPDVRGV